MKFIFFVIVASVFFNKGYCAKCMTPDDARYLTPAFRIPAFWFSGHRRWHSGSYFPAPESPVQSSIIFLTTQDAGARMWWLKEQDSDLYMILTKEQTHILCTLIGAGLQVGWSPVSKEAKRSGYCHWEVVVNPDNPELFQLRNGELRNAIPDIGAVFFNRTGLYFNYGTSASNDPSNRIEDILTWWRWRRNETEQAPMASLPDQCEVGDSGVPLFMTEQDDLGRSSSRKRRRSRFTFATEDRFSRCGSRWYLQGSKCYRIYTAPGLSFDRTNKVCRILGGRITLPVSQKEHIFLRALMRRFARGQQYWLAAHVLPTLTSFDIRDFVDAEDHIIQFARWQRSGRLLPSQRCVLFSGGYWTPTSCNVRTGRVLCERDAEIKELPGAARCGKIQIRSVDARMASESFVASPRITDGEDARYAQFPWQVAIRVKKPIRVSGELVYHICGGSLIDNCWVMTAAHCFHKRDRTIYTVRIGDLINNQTDGTEQEFDIEELLIHENYESTPSHRRDIALVKLRKKGGQCAVFTETVQPACLPLPEYFSFKEDGELCQVSGWGVTNTSIGQRSAASRLQWVTIPTIKDKICSSKYNRRRPYFVKDYMFCAGHKNGGKDSCTGDSGGPFVCRGKPGSKGDGRYAVTGIVSFGIGCGKKIYPGVYTRVTQFLPWVIEKIRAYGDGNIVV